MIDELIKKISSTSGLSDDEINKKIDEKQEELSGLVSREGAAHMVAKELGVSLLQQQRLTAIKDINLGMKSVEFIGKITNIIEREFKTEKASGVVSNVFLADETGSIRLTLWNEEIDKLQDIRKGDVIAVRGYVKEDNLGEPEVRLGYRGAIQKMDTDIALPAKGGDINRVAVSELKEGDIKEVRAALLAVFESNMFYEICPQCSSRIKRENNFLCDEHGAVEPSFGIVLSGIIDDGTANMRIVMFGESAEHVLGMKIKEAKQIFDSGGAKEVIKHLTIGKEYVFQGKVRNNKFFNRLEFIVNSVKDVNVKEEILKLT